MAGPKGPGKPFRVSPLGCHVWIRSKDKDGYGYFRTNGRMVVAHRYYYELTCGPIPAGMDLDHVCDNRACVNPTHLEPKSHLANVRRSKVVKGMTMDKARQARAMRAGGSSYLEIAGSLGITENNVAQIVTNRNWRELPSPPPLSERGHTPLPKTGGRG